MKFEKSVDETNIDKYRVAKNTREYHIFLRIIFSKFMRLRQLFHVKNVNKNIMFKTDYWVTIIEFLNFLHCFVTNCIRNHHTEFEIERTILT